MSYVYPSLHVTSTWSLTLRYSNPVARLDTGMLGDTVAFDEGMEEMRHRVGEALYNGEKVGEQNIGTPS